MMSEVRNIIGRYFPNLSEVQWGQLEALPHLYEEWNAKINVISRKDIEYFIIRHLLHSMSIALFTSFKDGTKVLDVGTGGGLPGIPLSILFPRCQWTLIDSIGKKVNVAESIVESIGLSNTEVIQARAENMAPAQYHFVVSRAAMSMTDLAEISEQVIVSDDQFNALPNGTIALKGGDLTEELRSFREVVRVESLQNYLPNESFFKTKKVVYLPKRRRQ